MQKVSKLVSALALAAMSTVAGNAMAIPSISNADGVLDPFGGFDWAASSAAWTSGLAAAETALAAAGGDGIACGAACNFTIRYAGWAVSVTDTSGSPFPGLRLDATPNGLPNAGTAYEYTIFATLTGRLIAPTGPNAFDYRITSGNFDIYYDTTRDARTVSGGAWTGFTNGTNIISGTLANTGASFNPTLGTNALALAGAVTFTDPAFILPGLDGTAVSSTLQLFPATSGAFSPPTSVEGFAVDAVTEALFKADANQEFRLPEPTSMLLLGAALAGFGVASRRRNTKA